MGLNRAGKLMLAGVVCLSASAMLAGTAHAGIVLDDKSDFVGGDFTVIDFETRGDGSMFDVEPGNFTKLPHDEYTSSGVLISVPPDGSGDDRATLSNVTSARTLAALDAAGSPTRYISDRLFDGFVRFDFLVPVNAFGLVVLNRTDADPVSISYFDAKNVLLSTVNLNGALIDGVVLGADFDLETDLSYGFIGFHDPAQTFAYAIATDDIAHFDDLHFGMIPEPMSGVLLLVGVASWVLRRRPKAAL